MQREVINPWQWQEQYGFVQGNKVVDASTVLYIAGQIAADEHGRCLHAGSMEKQLEQVIVNIEAVLSGAGMDFTHVVRLNVYTVDSARSHGGASQGAGLPSRGHLARCFRARGSGRVGRNRSDGGLLAATSAVELPRLALDVAHDVGPSKAASTSRKRSQRSKPCAP